MYEDSKVRGVSPTTEIEFAHVELPQNWDGKRTVTAQDAEDGEYRLAVHPSVASALRRAVLLVPHDLCTRIDLGVVDDPAARLQIVRVYGEG